MIKTQKPDQEHYESLTNKGFTRDKAFCKAQYEPLKLRLLNIGGWAVILPMIEEDFDKIISRGLKFPGDSMTMRGEPSRCHSNSANLWDKNRNKLKISTGYALSKDGLWRQHTWCVWRATRSWRVVETTAKRIQYYGFIMDEEESEHFLENNYY